MIGTMLILGGLPLIAGVTAYLSARARWWIGALAVVIMLGLGTVAISLLGSFGGVAVPVLAALVFGWVCSALGRLISDRPHMIASTTFLLTFALAAVIWAASRTTSL